MSIKLGILLFDGVELLDFAGPYECFSVAASLQAETTLTVCSIGTHAEIQCEHGPKVTVDYLIDNAPDCDWLLVPGGQGVRTLMRTPEQLNWLVRHGEAAELLMSVCTGSLALGACGFLQGLEVTSHHDYLDVLKTVSPACIVNPQSRYVDSGRIVTSAGVSAGIDMSLYIIGREFGCPLKDQTADYLQYFPKTYP